MKRYPLHTIVNFNLHKPRFKAIMLWVLVLVFMTLPGCIPAPITAVITQAGEYAQIIRGDTEVTSASVGQKVNVGDELIVPPSDSLEINLSDESVIRLSNGSHITLLSLNQGDQAARFYLHNGSVWIILAGKEVEVQTVSGNALVRGSMMSVTVVDSIVPGTTVTCLEGHCELSNAFGNTIMSSGQAAAVSSPQDSPNPVTSMSPEQYSDWVEVNPDSKTVVADKGGEITAEENPNWMGIPGYLNVVVEIPCSAFQTNLGNAACFPVRLENNCRGGEGSPIGTWYWSFISSTPIPGSNYMWRYPIIAVVPGGSYSLVLPAFTYSDVWAWSSSDPGNRQHWVNQTYTAESSINVRMCPDEPALPTEPLTEPLRYDLQNNCQSTSADSHANTVWHWRFEQLRGKTINDLILMKPFEISLAPGESASGELAPGIWLERDWTENGSVNNPKSMRIGGFDQVRLCPDEPPLSQP